MWAAGAGSAMSVDTLISPSILDALAYAKGVLVLADSDAKTNVQVRTSMQALSDAITAQTGKPSMFTFCREPEKAQGRKTSKRGLDDWIHDEGALAVEKYLTWLWSKELARQRVLSSGGYFPLGYNGDTNYVWSIPRGSMFALSASQLTQPGTLLNLAGGNAWCEAAYGQTSKLGAVQVDFQRMGGDIVGACIAAGPFDPEACRRTGVWDSGDGALVINGADHLWRTDGGAQDRFGSEFVYPGPRPQAGPRGGYPSGLRRRSARTRRRYLHLALAHRRRRHADARMDPVRVPRRRRSLALAHVAYRLPRYRQVVPAKPDRPHPWQGRDPSAMATPRRQAFVSTWARTPSRC